ncbi:MAG: 50S ribosomal protein L24 [candidate division Zixibacteria bacterium]|nr:50S ribosomal protein L24 [candidate division Zixibacteria bacterium]
MRIKKGDTIFVRTGADKGKTGKVLSVDVDKKLLVIEGINMRNKHQRPTQKQPKGGIISMEQPIHLSNVAIYSSSLSGPTKIASRVITEGNKKKRVRICRKTGEEI